jgi:hypothetical protein
VAFDLTAWTVIAVIGYGIGSRVLALLGVERLRTGDRFIIGTWIGIAFTSIALLGASLFIRLSPEASAVTMFVLAALAAVTTRRVQVVDIHPREMAEAPVPLVALISGVALAAVGAAALASDPVTLYDSLVYHVGIIRWLHEHGTVPGIALIHNRLGHVSAWFALGAAFDAGPATNRAANVPLGIALVLVAMQGAIAAARIASRRGSEADWFLLLTTAALVWVGVTSSVTSPSPDVVTNVLIVLTAWSMLVVPRASIARHHAGWRRWLTPRLIPFILGVAASTMKLFAVPAAAAAGLFYIFGRGDDSGARDAGIRAAICGVLGTCILAPFLAANLVASGCPLFPSRIGCTALPWSLGATQASKYAHYIRNVAQWESRRSVSSAAELPWIGPWIGAHPLMATLAALAVPLAFALLRGPRRDGVRSALLLAVLGLAFAGWQAPAPRFLFSFVLIAPALAVAYPLSALNRTSLAHGASDATASRRAAAGFLAATLVVGFGYAIASQKLNVRSAVVRHTALFNAGAGELLMPAAPKSPARLYVWRVNDIELVTPVPKPIADTLSFDSAIDDNTAYEQCSTAPLPCTPYVRSVAARLRTPERGVSGGFVRLDANVAVDNEARCIGELLPPVLASVLASAAARPPTPPHQCGPGIPR